MYKHHWDCFTSFQSTSLCDVSFPASPHSVALFIIHLSQRKLAIRTIRTYTSAISYVHKLNNQIDPTNSFLVSKAILGLQNQNQQSQRPPLQPITRPILYKLIDCIPACAQSLYYVKMWTALFQLCFHACLRVGEAVQSSSTQHTLQLHQLLVSPTQVTIAFSSYKHSNQATPSIVIQSHPQGPASRCPVLALTQYLDLRSKESGPLFVDPLGVPLHRSAFCSFLKQVLTAAGLDHNVYNTHSFRIGRATQLAQDNHSSETIRSAGRWKSSAYIGYIRSSNINLPP